MKTVITASAAVALLLAALAADGERHLEMRQQAMRMHSGVNFTDLRFATVGQPLYDPYYFASQEHWDALAVIKAGPPDRATVACRDLTDTQFVSIALHDACAQRLSALGQDQEAERHRFVRDGLVASLVPDEQGVVTVINVEEEYEFAARKGYEVVGHASLLSKQGGQRLSTLTVVDDTGETSYIHFMKHPAYERIQRSMIDDALEKQEQ